MSSINKFYIMGRLVRDPELKELESGKKVSNVTLAVDRDYKDKEKNTITDFLNYTLWDKDAENICTISKKGSVVYFEGSFNDKVIEIDNKKIHTFNPVVEKYRHIAHAKNMDSEVENTNETEMVK